MSELMNRMLVYNYHIGLRSLLFIHLLFPVTLHASFIESTIGTAVVNDATASYHNPAALTLIDKPQFIALGSFADSRSHFTGQFRQPRTGLGLSGNSNNQTHYYLPSAYLAIRASDKLVAGFAVITNSFNRELENNAILRYAQANNSIKNADFLASIGIKINQYIAVGAGVNFSTADFLLKPISGFPGMNVPDSQSRNDSHGNSWGGDIGLLLKPAKSTLIGFNYRSANTYSLKGNSFFGGNPPITSNNYHFKFWTPARSVLSINQFVTSDFGFITTLQHIQWHIIQNVTIYNIATQLGGRSLIIPKAIAPYHLRNSWLLTLGTHYRIRPECVVRVAGTYNQSPGNGHYQITTGDSYILGSSIGYDLNKQVTVDASYAHAFIQNASIQILSNLNQINGINRAERDSISLKLTIKGIGV